MARQSTASEFTRVSSAKTGLRCGNWLLSEDVAQDAAGVQAKGGKGIGND